MLLCAHMETGGVGGVQPLHMFDGLLWSFEQTRCLFSLFPQPTPVSVYIKAFFISSLLQPLETCECETPPRESGRWCAEVSMVAGWSGLRGQQLSHFPTCFSIVNVSPGTCSVPRVFNSVKPRSRRITVIHPFSL